MDFWIYTFKIVLMSLCLVNVSTLGGDNFSRNTQYRILVKAEEHEDEIVKIFRQMEERNRKLLKEFFGGDLDDGIRPFEDKNLKLDPFKQGNLFDHFKSLEQSFMEDGQGGFRWTETETHRLLTIPGKLKKNAPLDIKIKNGQFTIQGETDRTKFQYSLTLPKDIDIDRPEYSTTDNEFVAKFLKISQKHSSPSKKVIPNINKENDKDRFPLSPDPSEKGTEI